MSAMSEPLRNLLKRPLVFTGLPPTVQRFRKSSNQSAVMSHWCILILTRTPLFKLMPLLEV